MHLNISSDKFFYFEAVKGKFDENGSDSNALWFKLIQPASSTLVDCGLLYYGFKVEDWKEWNRLVQHLF